MTPPKIHLFINGYKVSIELVNNESGNYLQIVSEGTLSLHNLSPNVLNVSTRAHKPIDKIAGIDMLPEPTNE